MAKKMVIIKLKRCELKNLCFLFIVFSNLLLAESNQEVFIQQGHNRYVNSANFSLDGKYIVSASDDNNIKLWDVATGKVIRTISGHTEAVKSAVFSPDNKYIVSSSRDDTNKLWETATGKEIKTFREYNFIPNSAIFSGDGKFIISPSTDRRIKMWDPATGKEIRIFKGHKGKVVAVDLSSDNKYLISASGDSTIRLWNSFTGEELLVFRGHQGMVNSVAFAPDDKFFASASDDNTVKLWDVTTGKELKTFLSQSIKKKTPKQETSVAFSPDGKQVVSISKNGNYEASIRIWDVDTGKENSNIQHDYTQNSAIFSPDGKFILLSYYNHIGLVDISSGKEIKTFGGNDESINSAGISKDGKNIAIIEKLNNLGF